MQMSLDVAMERTFTVAELGRLITDVLAHAFPHDVWIQGEVRDMNRANSGHVYFNVVDPPSEPGRPLAASLAVVLFDSTKRTVNNQIKRSGGSMRIDDGVSVRLRGVPDFYAPGGKLSLRMTGIDPAYTLGQLAASRDKLLRQLADEGLLEANRGLRSPEVPLRIGLVTAANSAAHADFIDELSDSGIAFQVIFASATVQGPGAPQQIAAGVRACQRRNVDVVVVIRGGGARTDLAAFDDEVVARAIAGCSVPVITGIGHEIDTAVADEIAHASFKTPTAAAAHLVQLGKAADERAHLAWRHIAHRASSIIESADVELDNAARVAGRSAMNALRGADDHTAASARRVRDLTITQLERSGNRLSGHLAAARLHSRHRLDRATTHLERTAADVGRNAEDCVDQAERRLDQAALRVRLLDPARALARGWSITTNSSGAVVRSVTDISAGSQLATRLSDGTINSTVATAPTQPSQPADPSPAEGPDLESRVAQAGAKETP
jgi:exodeoxyribonuclease VII large subunit